MRCGGARLVSTSRLGTIVGVIEVGVDHWRGVGRGPEEKPKGKSDETMAERIESDEDV